MVREKLEFHAQGDPTLPGLHDVVLVVEDKRSRTAISSPTNSGFGLLVLWLSSSWMAVKHEHHDPTLGPGTVPSISFSASVLVPADSIAMARIFIVHWGLLMVYDLKTDSWDFALTFDASDETGP
jgi:hypothetical protein